MNGPATFWVPCKYWMGTAATAPRAPITCEWVTTVNTDLKAAVPPRMALNTTQSTAAKISDITGIMTNTPTNAK